MKSYTDNPVTVAHWAHAEHNTPRGRSLPINRAGPPEIHTKGHAIMISQIDARRYYQAGQAAASTGQRSQDAIIDYFGGYQDWSSYACFDLGFRGQPFEIKTWERYHDIRLERNTQQPLPSYNHMDDRPEHGVSVMYPEWAQTVHGIFYIANAEAKGYKRIILRGLDTGYRGGDGEPLVIPIT